MRAIRRSAGALGCSPSGGFTLLEVLVVSTFLAFAGCALSASLLHAMTLNAVNEETGVASAAARRVLEEVASVPVDEAFARYTITGQVTKKGQVNANTFVVAQVRGTNMVAQVLFPQVDGSPALREDIRDDALGLPDDLDGDGVIDASDHSTDYILLPVRVRVTWQGLSGPRTFDLCTVLYRE